MISNKWVDTPPSLVEGQYGEYQRRGVHVRTKETLRPPIGQSSLASVLNHARTASGGASPGSLSHRSGSPHSVDKLRTPPLNVQRERARERVRKWEKTEKMTNNNRFSFDLEVKHSEERYYRNHRRQNTQVKDRSKERQGMREIKVNIEDTCDNVTDEDTTSLPRSMERIHRKVYVDEQKIRSDKIDNFTTKNLVVRKELSPLNDKPNSLKLRTSSTDTKTSTSSNNSHNSIHKGFSRSKKKRHTRNMSIDEKKQAKISSTSARINNRIINNNKTKTLYKFPLWQNVRRNSEESQNTKKNDVTLKIEKPKNVKRKQNRNISGVDETKRTKSTTSSTMNNVNYNDGFEYPSTSPRASAPRARSSGGTKRFRLSEISSSGESSEKDILTHITVAHVKNTKNNLVNGSHTTRKPHEQNLNDLRDEILKTSEDISEFNGSRSGGILANMIGKLTPRSNQASRASAIRMKNSEVIDYTDVDLEISRKSIEDEIVASLGHSTHSLSLSLGNSQNNLRNNIFRGNNLRSSISPALTMNKFTSSSVSNNTKNPRRSQSPFHISKKGNNLQITGVAVAAAAAASRSPRRPRFRSLDTSDLSFSDNSLSISFQKSSRRDSDLELIDIDPYTQLNTKLDTKTQTATNEHKNMTSESKSDIPSLHLDLRQSLLDSVKVDNVAVSNYSHDFDVESSRSRSNTYDKVDSDHVRRMKLGHETAESNSESKMNISSKSRGRAKSGDRLMHISFSDGPESWRMGELIGSGSFGCVYKALNEVSGSLFAVKQMQLDNASDDQALEIEREISLLKGLKHPNIVQYLGTERRGTCLHIFLEYVPGGSLSRMLSEFGAFPDCIIRRYTRHITQGISYLHDRKIIHRDIKGSNILVSDNGVAKLADFGCSKQMAGMKTNRLDESLKTLKGSIPWMAPEVIRQTGHGRKADIWSLGATVLEMATAKHPWPSFENNLSALFHVATANKPPPIPDSVSSTVHEFLGLCFCMKPEDRALASELLEHSFCSECELVDEEVLADNLNVELCLENISSSENEEKLEVWC
eukprot:GSMAST32.ASY1.ANO1.635.1 assembled CDS